MRRKILPALAFSLALAMSLAAEDARLVVRQPFKGAASSMQFSPDGQLFVTTAAKDIYFWHRQGILLRKLSHGEEITSFRFHPKGDSFAISDKSGRLVLQKPDGSVLHNVKLPAGYARTLAYSSDGTVLLAFSVSGYSLWNPDTGTKIRESNSAYFGSVALSPDNQLLAIGANDGYLALFRLSDGEKIFQVNSTGQIEALTFSPDSQRIYTGHRGKTSSAIFFTKTVRKFAVWDLTGKELNSENATGEIYSLAVSADGQSVITGSYNGFLEYWNLDGAQTRKIQAIPEATDYFSGLMNVIAPDPQSEAVLISSTNTGIFLMNPDSSRVFRLDSAASEHSPAFRLDLENNAIVQAEADSVEKKMRDRDSLINGIAQSPIADVIITTGYKDTVSLWNKQGVFLKKLNEPRVTTRLHMRSDNRGLVAHPKAAKFAVLFDYSTLTMMDFEGVVLWTAETKANSFGNIVFTPDGKLIAVPVVDAVQIWSETGTLVKTLKSAGYTKYLAYSKSGALLACGGSEEIHIWNSAGNLVTTLRDRSGKKLRFSADDRHLISGTESENLVIWETKGFTEVARIGFGDQGNYALAASDGRFDFAGAADGLLFWLVGDQLIGLDQFREKYHTPGLLRAILGGKSIIAKPEVAVSKRLVGRVFQIKGNGDVVIFTKVSGSLRAGKKLKILNGANYVDATISNTLHTNVTAKAKGTVAVGNPVFE